MRDTADLRDRKDRPGCGGGVAERAQPPHLVLVTSSRPPLFPNDELAWGTVDGGDISHGSHWTWCLRIPLPAEGKEGRELG